MHAGYRCKYADAGIAFNMYFFKDTTVTGSYVCIIIYHRDISMERLEHS